MARERLKRTVLLVETMPFSATVETLDVHELRAAFSALFDHTAKQVFLQGLDLDDVVVERLLDFRRSDGATVRVPLPSLSDRASIASAVCMSGAAEDGDARHGNTAEVCAIVARVIRERPVRNE